jgi:hypothetical protein
MFATVMNPAHRRRSPISEASGPNTCERLFGPALERAAGFFLSSPNFMLPVEPAERLERSRLLVECGSRSVLRSKTVGCH